MIGVKNFKIEALLIFFRKKFVAKNVHFKVLKLFLSLLQQN